MECLGVEVQRGVDPDQAAVAGRAALDVAHARVLLRPRRGQDLGDQRVVQALEGRPNAVVHGRPEVRGEPLALGRGPAGEPVELRERRQERPVGDRAVEQLLQDRDGAVAGRPAGHPSVGEAAAQGRQVAIRVDGHRAPAGDHVSAVSGGLEALVVGDLEELGRHAVERVHVPLKDARVQLGDVRGDGLAQRRQRDRVLAREPVRVEGRRAVPQGREARPGRGDAFGRGIREAVVEPRVADGGREQGVGLEERVPVLGREAGERRRRAGVRGVEAVGGICESVHRRQC